MTCRAHCPRCRWRKVHIRKSTRQQTAAAQTKAGKAISLGNSQTVEARSVWHIENDVMIWKRIAGDNEEICPFRRWSQAPGCLQGGNAISRRLEMNQHLVLVGAETLDFFDV